VKFLSGFSDHRKRCGARIAALAAALVVAASGAGCGTGASVTGTAGYKPPFLPLVITINSAGNISIHEDLSVATPAGTFFLEASVSKKVTSAAGTTVLTIEHRKGIAVVYTVFRIKSQQIDVSLNGAVRLTVTSGHVLVNAVRAHVQSIVIRSADSSPLDSCLVGTWRDAGGPSSTTWAGHQVAMHGGGGNIDHIYPSGIDRDSWSSAKPLYGTYQGHLLKEIVRGDNTLSLVNTVHRNELEIVEDGWRAGGTNTFVYEGRSSLGYFDKSGTYMGYFRCTAHTLTWHTGGSTNTETRVSRQP
jgi:hypothetical protein